MPHVVKTHQEFWALLIRCIMPKFVVAFMQNFIFLKVLNKFIFDKLNFLKILQLNEFIVLIHYLTVILLHKLKFFH